MVNVGVVYGLKPHDSHLSHQAEISVTFWEGALTSPNVNIAGDEIKMNKPQESMGHPGGIRLTFVALLTGHRKLAGLKLQIPPPNHFHVLIKSGFFF
jgi:hypothetical protein